ncbi:PepSY domain-containing protein [Taklimakanibacter lacteus]|uniref:PepSY domain-containing protein n=1 Tax=Taklimakanibacter lacteus TaxID=2268456 RepID=UPI000E66D923
MKKLLIHLVLAVGLMGGAGSAFASDDETQLNVPRDKWLTVTQVTEKFTAQGYDVRQVKIEKGAYEVYAVAKDGKRVEVLVHPGTGEILGDEAGED